MIPLRDNIVQTRPPVVVYTLIAMNAAVFLVMLLMPKAMMIETVYHYGLVPRHYFAPSWDMHYGSSPESYWPFLTATFIHGGWMHIIFNMWTLYIFGSTLEVRFGPVLFLVFYLCCAVASMFSHAYFYPLSTAPVIGASGAIAGLIGAYALTFSRARITILIPFFFISLIFSIPALAFAAIWFLFQVMQGVWTALSPSVGDSVAWWAHVGGFLTGLILLPIFLLLAPARAMQYRWHRDPWNTTDH
ncbi:MAG: rhomboid family intramembrane serine protease [Alphaproteobacteria bacterium]